MNFYWCVSQYFNKCDGTTHMNVPRILGFRYATDYQGQADQLPGNATIDV